MHHKGLLSLGAVCVVVVVTSLTPVHIAGQAIGLL
jgi:hypothetical protein